MSELCPILNAALDGHEYSPIVLEELRVLGRPGAGMDAGMDAAGDGVLTKFPSCGPPALNADSAVSMGAGIGMGMGMGMGVQQLIQVRIGRGKDKVESVILYVCMYVCMYSNNQAT